MQEADLAALHAQHEVYTAGWRDGCAALLEQQVAEEAKQALVRSWCRRRACFASPWGARLHCAHIGVDARAG